MSTDTLVVPAELVGSLRGGLHSVLGMAAEEIATLGMDVRRECDPEFYSDALGCFDGARALLDVIGWVETGRQGDVRLDLRSHWQALLEALGDEIGVIETQLKEADAVDANRARRGMPPIGKQMAQRLLALRSLTESVQAQADRLDGSR